MKTRSGITLISETKGPGSEVSKGDRVKLALTGWLNKGEVIQENEVVEIVVGARNLIPGIEYSIQGMKAGGRRKVKISPHLGYGEKGVPGEIPENAVLVYEIEVLSVYSNV